MASVFISYTRENSDVATSLKRDIEALGRTAWLDHDLSGGQAWWDTILDAIRTCDVFVQILDSTALESHACDRERAYAVALGKTVLPVRTASARPDLPLPPDLSPLQWIDYRPQDYGAALKLARALHDVRPGRPLPDPLPPAPKAPVSELDELAAKVRQGSLTYHEQCGLLLDLKRQIRLPGRRAEAYRLLEQFRSRGDLFASVAEEIDQLPKRVDPTPIWKPKPRTTIHDRVFGGLVGAAVGAVFGVTGRMQGMDLIWVGYAGAGGGIAGWLTGRNGSIFVAAMAGVAFGIALLGAQDPSSSLIRLLAFVGPPGAVVGALAGALAEARTKGAISTKDRWLGGAGLFAASGILGGIVLMTTVSRWFPNGAILCAGVGGLAGVLIALNWTSLLATLGGIVISALVGAVLDRANAYGTAWMLLVPAGACAGALVGAVAQLGRASDSGGSLARGQDSGGGI